MLLLTRYRRGGSEPLAWEVDGRIEHIYIGIHLCLCNAAQILKPIDGNGSRLPGA